MKLNLKKILITIKTMGEYLFPYRKVMSKFTKINTKEDLKNFIQGRSAHVTQTTLYGYLKTRMGHKFTLMVDDEKFSKSINIAKWNIYVSAISDLTFYVFSYLVDKKNLLQNDAEEIFNTIINKELENGLSEEIANKAKQEFALKLKSIDWKKFHLEDPFKNSGLALYDWSPIADELKVLDKEIVLNSIKLKWNIVENELKNLTKDLTFN